MNAPRLKIAAYALGKFSVLRKLKAHDLAAYLFCQVVGRGTETARGYDNIAAPESRFKLLRKANGIVPHRAAVQDGYAQLRKPF